MSTTQLSADEKYEKIANLVDFGDERWFPPAGKPVIGTPPDWLSQPPVDGETTRKHGISKEILIKCAAQPLNDTGNGQRLLIHFGDQLLNVAAVGWHTWIETHWSRQGGDEAIVSFAQRCASLISAEADVLTYDSVEQADIDSAEEAARLLRSVNRSEQSERQVRQFEARISAGKAAKAALAKRKVKRQEFAVFSGNSARISGMISQALPHCTVPPQELDGDPVTLNVANGTLRFVRGQADSGARTCSVVLHTHDASDRLSKIAAVDYDPNAKCPRFHAFLGRFQPKHAVQTFLQTYHGYGLTGLTSEQCLIFNYGLGANGKSTFVDILAQIMGDYAKTLGFESLVGEGIRRGDQATPDLARLPGARLVRVSEPEGAVRLKEGLIKSLTGGEPMSVRHLNKGFFEFKPEFKLVLSANRKPTIHGIDHGIWRRIRLIPWTVTISDDEKRPLAEVLAEFWEERSGILNWLIEGAIRYLTEGLVTPNEIKDATATYRSEQDPLQSFINACVELVPAIPGQQPLKVAARTMYEAYCSWCVANSERPWSEKAFGQNLPQKGIAKIEGRIRQYVNVRLHDVPTTANRPNDDSSDDDEVPF
jgi:putative DNA primase/helicase